MAPIDDGDEIEIESRPTEGIRIIGATEAGDLVKGDTARSEGELVSDSQIDPSFDIGVAGEPRDLGERDDLFSSVTPSLVGDDEESTGEVWADQQSGDIELPHWTEPPTGEVPSVLARASGVDNAGQTLSGPTWRDEGTGWSEDEFDHSLLAESEAETDLDVPDLKGLEGKELFSFEDLGEPSGSRIRSGVFGEAPVGLSADDATRQPRGADSSQQAPRDLESASMASGHLAGAETPGAVQGAQGQNADLGSVVGERRTVRIGAGGGQASLPGDAPFVRSNKQHANPGRNVGVAVAVGIGIGALIVVLFLFGPATALLVVGTAVFVGEAEYFAVMRKAGYRPASLLGLVATIAIMIAAYEKGESALIVVLAIMIVFTLLWYLWGVTDSRPASGVAVTLLGFAWVSFLGSFAALLLNPRIHPERHGVALLFGAIVATVAYDVAAFAAGSRFGKHPMAPRISPNKTWEGLAAGMLASVVISVVFLSHLHPWSESRALILGVVVAIAAPLGDLCQSMIKRDAGVKDMGSAIPGHGGVLDRIDAMLFVMPAVYFLARVLNIS
ncbi:MAG TPA: phosphatidate cytidylyltransferase [Acidimicrobiales bacterium]|nr:phosphatidate cytidylyltransferase [Acidimicrobiales bacterium]